MAIVLNGELREVVSRCLCQSANAAHFLSTEEPEPKPAQHMNLQHILAKTRSLTYQSVQEFQHDIQQVVLSAQQAERAGEDQPQVAQWALELQDLCQAELEARPNLVPPCGDSGTAGSGRACQDATSLAGKLDRPSTTLPSSMDLDSGPADLQKDVAADHLLQPSATCSECLPSSDTEDNAADELSRNPGIMLSSLGPSQTIGAQPLGNGITTVMTGVEGLGSSEHISCHYMAAAPMECGYTAGSTAPMEATAAAPVKVSRRPQMVPHGAAVGWSDEDEEGGEEGDEEPAGEDAMDYDAGEEQAGEGHSQHAQSAQRHVAGPPVGAAAASITAQGSSALSSLEALVAACELAAEKEGLGQDCHYYQELVAESPVLYTGVHQGAPAAPQLGAQSVPQSPLPTSPQTAKAHAHEGDGFTAASGSGQMHAAQDAAQLATHGIADAGPKYRRHKSKVFIRPNKVVYLPTTFMEEAFDPARLPINCCMVVEADGQLVAGETHHVTIKAVPRQGLSTMYCMTNVMKFQQQYLNWQILHWTKMDDHHIKIHLQGPHSNGPVVLPRTSSVPTPRASLGTKHGSCAAPIMLPARQLSPASAKAGSSHPSFEPLYDTNQMALLRSLSTCIPEPAAPACNAPHGAPFYGMGEGGLMGMDGGEEFHPEGTRRSTRAVRMTAVMAEHLQQERLQLASQKLQPQVGGRMHAGQRMGSAEGMPMFSATPAVFAANSHKRGSEVLMDLHPSFLKPQLGLHGSLPGHQPFGLPGMHGLTGSHSVPTPDLFSLLPVHTRPAHPASCPGGFMEGSATANLYYMPQAKRTMSNAAATVTTPAPASPGAFPGPTTQGPGLVSGGSIAAAAPAAGGIIAPLPSSSGPRCIMTPSHAGMAPAAPALPGSCQAAQCFSNGAAGVTAVLGASEAAPGCMLPAPKPLNMDLSDAEHRTGSPSVGILGPSLNTNVLTTLLSRDSLFAPFSAPAVAVPDPVAIHKHRAASAVSTPFTAAAQLVKNRQGSEDADGSGHNTSSSGIGNEGPQAQHTSCSDTSDSGSGRTSGSGGGMGLLELDGPPMSPSARKRSTSSIDAAMAAAMQALPLHSAKTEPVVVPQQFKAEDASAGAYKRRKAEPEGDAMVFEQQPVKREVVPMAPPPAMGPSPSLLAAAAAATATLQQRHSASLGGGTLNIPHPSAQNHVLAAGPVMPTSTSIGSNVHNSLHHAMGMPTGAQMPLSLPLPPQPAPMLHSQMLDSSKPAIGVPSGPYNPFMMGSHMSAMQALFALSQLQPLGPPQSQPLPPQPQPTPLMATANAAVGPMHGMSGMAACAAPPAFHPHPHPHTIPAAHQGVGPACTLSALGYHLQ